MTIEYDPTHFSLDQVKALAREVGLVLVGGVHHCMLDLPDMARPEYAGPLDENLMRIPGVAHAAVNPSARTFTVEYFADVVVTDEDIIGHLQDWGYRVRDFRLPADWWDRHLLAVYSAVTVARQQALPISEATNLQATPGKAVAAQLNGRLIHIGTNGHLQDNGFAIPYEVGQQIGWIEAQCKTVILAGEGLHDGTSSHLLGLIAVADTVRPEAALAVVALKAAGVEKVVMLTGDNARADQAIGTQAAVDAARAELLPEEKVTAVKSLLAEYGSVAMVGDGVIDAPALAVIVTLIVSTILNIISLPMGVAGHEDSTVIVVLNGLRLLRYQTAAAAIVEPIGAGA
jgi:cation transport ATPase